MKHFVAFSSRDKIHAKTIEEAAQRASTPEVSYITWSQNDASGSPIDKAVESWIDDAEAFVADITYVNDNVTYEIGYALGSGKNVRLVRNSSVESTEITQVGLLDVLLRDEFTTGSQLEAILRGRDAPKSKWTFPTANLPQPVYVLAPPVADSFTTKLFSSVKKQARFKFRSFKAWEMGRLTAQEAWEQAAGSFGVIVSWQNAKDHESNRNNQRAAFLYGVGQGAGIPALLLAHANMVLPTDLHSKATRWNNLTDLDLILRGFRDDVQDAINDHSDQHNLPYMLLDGIQCGDPAAENEQEQLKRYFLETEEFKQTLVGENNLLIGRKGSGKSAIFLQVRDRVRVDKKNIVVDLNPEGYQLVKFKEMVSDLKSLGVRKEFITAFWQYILWLEIAYKILEKDERAAQRDGVLGQQYDRLKDLFSSRVDTGAGDFSERLRLLTDMIATRFEKHRSSAEVLSSSEVLQVIYGKEIAEFRSEVLSYLKLKGRILFLFDNLDRMRTPGGFDETDGLVILGLVESMQEISKHFRRKNFDFHWVVFIRSDVYEFVVRQMADYGKHASRMLDWSDHEVLKRVLKKRIESSNSGSWEVVWPQISVLRVHNIETLDFIVAASLMRPRYIIRLFEMAKRRAINMGHQKIEESDYDAALEDLGWTVIEDLDLELRDIVKNADLLLFDIAQLDGACGLPELREAIANRVGATQIVERVIDVLLWSGAIGIAQTSESITYIYECGYKLQFMRSLMDRNPDAEVKLHPTLGNLVAKKKLISKAA